MATSSSSNRPVVLSLRELERYPTVYDRYEMTLPFYNKALRAWDNPLECSCRESVWVDPLGSDPPKCEGCNTSISFAKVKAMAVRQTEKRWSWFSEGRKLDDRLGRRLGTLGFLPLEIREKIWLAAIERCVDTTDGVRCCRHDWEELEHIKSWKQGPLNMIRSFSESAPHREVCGDNVFNFYNNPLFFQPWYSNGVIQLRHASPDAKIEIENVFVFTNDFRFSCPVVFGHFLNTLSARQITLLRSVTIELSCCYNCCLYPPPRYHRLFEICCEAWIAVIERLPATVQSVTFELGWQGLYLTNPRWIHQDKYDNTAMALLGTMTKKTRRQAPNATISTVDRYEWDREILQGLLAELDEYSEDYKKWWRESREKTMSHKEET